jgi:hypothetical protein
VDDIAWVKATVNRRMAKGHGFYLQHAKETCLVGLKGEDPPNTQGNRCSDVIFSERRGQSQKPEEIYHIMEALVPNGNPCPAITPLSSSSRADQPRTRTRHVRAVSGDLCAPKQPAQPLGVCGSGALVALLPLPSLCVFVSAAVQSLLPPHQLPISHITTPHITSRLLPCTSWPSS